MLLGDTSHTTVMCTITADLQDLLLGFFICSSRGRECQDQSRTGLSIRGPDHYPLLASVVFYFLFFFNQNQKLFEETPYQKYVTFSISVSVTVCCTTVYVHFCLISCSFEILNISHSVLQTVKCTERLKGLNLLLPVFISLTVLSFFESIKSHIVIQLHKPYCHIWGELVLFGTLFTLLTPVALLFVAQSQKRKPLHDMQLQVTVDWSWCKMAIWPV